MEPGDNSIGFDGLPMATRCTVATSPWPSSKMCSKIEAASNKPATGKEFKYSYPNKQPMAGMQRNIEGKFIDFEMPVTITVYESQSTECLMRSDIRMF